MIVMIRLLVWIVLGFSCAALNAQTELFSEDFGTGCDQGQLVSAFTSPNGTWTVTETGSNETASSQWYVSATENNTGEGNCGAGCGENRTLHVSSVTVLGIPADQGALYYEGISGFCDLFPCGATNRRVESPIIDCSGATEISLQFLYLEGGNVQDNATVWYFDGLNWAEIDDPAKTFSGVCSPQGVWTAYTLSLPASADNNPNVRVGFEWTNNDDGNATDPSFAVDDIIISGVIDEDPTSCPGDFNLDGFINSADLLLFLSEFGCETGCIYDMDGDGVSNVADLLSFLEVYATECP